MASILLIDDDSLVRESLAIHLQDAGHQVEAAADGRAGVEAFRAGRFELVITDLFMPEVEGIETIRLLRQDNSQVPIIAITGGPSMPSGTADRTTPDYLRMARALGATEIIQKPFSLSELLGLVDACLSGQGPSRGDAG